MRTLLVVLLAVAAGAVFINCGDACGDSKLVERVLAEGADPNSTDCHGGTAIIQAARLGRADVIPVLVRHGADPNQRGGINGWTPLLHAIHKRQPGSALELLRSGADPNARDASGKKTPLMMAAGYGYTELVKLLLDNGANAYATSGDGESALTIALTGVPDIDRFTMGDCQEDTVRVLLERAPGLRLDNTAASRRALALARLKGCTAAFAAEP